MSRMRFNHLLATRQLIPLRNVSQWLRILQEAK